MDLEKELEKFDVPEWRRTHLNFNNLSWLARNLFIRNSDNPRFQIVQEEIKRKLLEKDYLN